MAGTNRKTTTSGVNAFKVIWARKLVYNGNEVNLVDYFMPDKKPQNPVYRIEPGILDVCLPKVICPHCSTVVVLRKNGRTSPARCPSCGEFIAPRVEDIESPDSERLEQN